MSFTGDELKIQDKSYTIIYKDGTLFVLGKLLEREKTFDAFHGSYSSYYNHFRFENNPDMKQLNTPMSSFHASKIFSYLPEKER